MAGNPRCGSASASGAGRRPPSKLRPARGIFNSVVLGSVLWALILATASLSGGFSCGQPPVRQAETAADLAASEGPAGPAPASAVARGPERRLAR